MYNVPQRSVEQDDPKSDHFYAVLNDQDGQSRPDQPVYHAGNHVAEPTYNVLEDADLEALMSMAPFQHKGRYTTL